MANKSSFRIDADTSPYEEAMQRLTAATAEAVTGIKDKFEGINSSFESMKSIFEGAIAVLGGGALAEQLEKVADRAEQMRNSAEIFGLSTTALQGLQVMAEETGVSSDRLQRAMATLEQKMRTAGEEGGAAAEKFNRLGITTAQLLDPTFTVEDAMQRMGAATNSNAALLTELGARGAALIPMLREMASDHDAVGEAAARVGALTQTEIGYLQAYHGQVEIASEAWKNFESRVLTGVVPAMEAVLTGMTKFDSSVDNAVDATNILRAGLDAVGTAFIRTVMGGRMLIDVLIGAYDIGNDVFNGLLVPIDAVRDEFIGLVAAMQDASSGRLDKIGADLTKGITTAGAEFKTVTNQFITDSADMVAHIGDDAKEATQKIQAMQDALTATPKASVPPPAASTAPLQPLGPDFAQSAEDAMSKALEKISEEINTKLGGDFKKITADVVADAKTQEDAQVGSIDRQIAAVQELRATHQISSQQELTQTMQLLDQKWQAEQAYYDRIKLADSGNLAALAKDNTEEESAWQKHLDEMQKAQDKATTEMQVQWKKVGDTIASAFETNIDKMLKGTQGFTQTVRNTFASLATDLINSFVKIGVEWVEQELLKLAQSKLTALGVISSNAGAAGAAGTASFAQAPWPADLGAPAFGAAMMADVLSYSSVVGAEGGYDIPTGVTPPLVQPHEGEMILPRDIADNVREGAAGATHYHMHVQAMDADSFHDYLHKPASRTALASSIKTLNNRGGR